MVAGILDLGNKGANQRSGFIALHSGQSLLGYPGGITGIDVNAGVAVAQRGVFRGHAVIPKKESRILPVQR